MTPDADALRPMRSIIPAAERLVSLYEVEFIEEDPLSVRTLASEGECNSTIAELVGLLRNAVDAQIAWEKENGIEHAIAPWLFMFPDDERKVISRAYGLGNEFHLNEDGSATLLTNHVGFAVRLGELTLAVKRMHDRFAPAPGIPSL